MLQIKNLRKEKNITQEQLAEKFEVDRVTVSRWENGVNDPPIEALVEMSEMFEVTTDYLLGKTSIRTPITTIAAHRSDDFRKELPPEKVAEIDNFIKFHLEQHRKNQGL